MMELQTGFKNPKLDPLRRQKVPESVKNNDFAEVDVIL